MHQKNAWVNPLIFHEWFYNAFVPTVQSKLREKNLPPKALLLLDNCSAHPDVSELASGDGLIKSVFLPPNVTSLIQPMDQGVLESLKRRYRKCLLQDLLLSEKDIATFLKEMNVLRVVEKVALAWEGITAVTISRSWAKIIPLESAGDDTSCSVSNLELVQDLQSLGCNVQEKDVEEWMATDDRGYEHFVDDDAIVKHVQGMEDSENSNSEDDIDSSAAATVVCPVSNTDAVHMLEQCLQWLHFQPDASQSHTTAIIILKDIATKKLLHVSD